MRGSLVSVGPEEQGRAHVCRGTGGHPREWAACACHPTSVSKFSFPSLPNGLGVKRNDRLTHLRKVYRGPFHGGLARQLEKVVSLTSRRAGRCRPPQVCKEESWLAGLLRGHGGNEASGLLFSVY